MASASILVDDPVVTEVSELRVFLNNRAAVLGVGLVVLLVAISSLAPVLTPYDPLRQAGPPLTQPGPGYPMGTDDLRHDVLAQVLYGERVSLGIGFSAAAIALVIGVLMGSVAGFFGGVVDDLIMRVVELFQVIPRIFLAILLVALFGQHVGVTAVAIGVLSWPGAARVLRAEFLARREAEYVMAARVLGAGPLHLIFREILPNAISPVIVITSLNIGGAILLEAGLAFLGLSDANVPSLGRMLLQSIQFIQVAWWMSLFPGVFLALLVLAMNLTGDGLSDVLNPRLHQ